MKSLATLSLQEYLALALIGGIVTLFCLFFRWNGLGVAAVFVTIMANLVALVKAVSKKRR